MIRQLRKALNDTVGNSPEWVGYLIIYSIADLMAFYRAAIHRGCTWKASKSHATITDDICENGKFYPNGWVILDHQSPKIWSFKNINDVVKFLNDRPIVAEDL